MHGCSIEHLRLLCAASGFPYSTQSVIELSNPGVTSSSVIKAPFSHRLADRVFENEVFALPPDLHDDELYGPAEPHLAGVCSTAFSLTIRHRKSKSIFRNKRVLCNIVSNESKVTVRRNAKRLASSGSS